jgi:hypothetical protein
MGGRYVFEGRLAGIRHGVGTPRFPSELKLRRYKKIVCENLGKDVAETGHELRVGSPAMNLMTEAGRE